MIVWLHFCNFTKGVYTRDCKICITRYALQVDNVQKWLVLERIMYSGLWNIKWLQVCQNMIKLIIRGLNPTDSYQKMELTIIVHKSNLAPVYQLVYQNNHM